MSQKENLRIVEKLGDLTSLRRRAQALARKKSKQIRRLSDEVESIEKLIQGLNDGCLAVRFMKQGLLKELATMQAVGQDGN